VFFNGVLLLALKEELACVEERGDLCEVLLVTCAYPISIGDQALSKMTGWKVVGGDYSPLQISEESALPAANYDLPILKRVLKAVCLESTRSFVSVFPELMKESSVDDRDVKI
jgi:hypothetical protein